jgi:hypothetical protein
MFFFDLPKIGSVLSDLPGEAWHMMSLGSKENFLRKGGYLVYLCVISTGKNWY